MIPSWTSVSWVMSEKGRPLDGPDDDSLLDVRELGDVGEGQTPGPLVDHLHQTEVEALHEVSDGLQQSAGHLHLAYLDGGGLDVLHALLEAGGQLRLGAVLLLEDHAGQQRRYLLWRPVGQLVLKDQLGQDELVGPHLTANSSLELDHLVDVDVLELVEDVDPAVIVGQQCQTGLATEVLHPGDLLLDAHHVVHLLEHLPEVWRQPAVQGVNLVLDGHHLLDRGGQVQVLYLVVPHEVENLILVSRLTHLVCDLSSCWVAVATDWAGGSYLNL